MVFITDKQPMRSRDMKLPLLGIIAVVCLQLGFTAFNAIDRPIESLVAVNAVTSGTNPLAPTLDLRDVMFGVSDRVNSTKRSHAGDTITSVSTWRRNPQNGESSSVYVKKNNDTQKLKGMPQLVAMQKPFESTVITYPRAMLATTASDNYRITTASVRTPALEKRSFVSKTASVLKKPYTWLKALGSRLN